MEFNSNRITELTWKYVKEELSPGEQAELDAWLADPYNRERFEERVKVENILKSTVFRSMAKDDLDGIGRMRGQEAGEASVIQSREPEVVHRRVFRLVAAAAVVALVAGSSLWWWHERQPLPGAGVAAVQKEPLGPGGDKATLILSDQQKITLDDAHKGKIAQQGNAEVAKTDSTLLSYSVRAKDERTAGDATIAFNTLVTPRGGQYQLRLADGTTVFLNAQSSLKFPVSFNGKERRVMLQGEGYFEVAPDSKRPFRVEMSGGKEIVVLGTRFDVQDYPDDPAASATLLEGKVRVDAGSRSAVLGVDDRVTIAKDGALTTAMDEDAEARVAWTKGLFRFSNMPLADVMRQLSRWYDVDVRFEGTPPEISITASISRNMSAWRILDALKDVAGLKYQVKGREVLVLH